MQDKSKPELNYQIGSPSVTRGQFRILLFLMLIQVVITAQATYAPGFIAWVKNAWAQHQQAAAHRAQVMKNLADWQLWLAYSQPADKVIWDEDPDRAAKLLAAGRYQPVLVDGQITDFFSDAVPPAARADLPVTLPDTVLGGLGFSAAADASIIFLHGRQATGQPERLVAVAIYGDLRTTEVNGSHQVTDTFDGVLWKWQTLAANSFGTNKDEGTLIGDRGAPTTLNFQPGLKGSEATQMPAHWAAPDQPGNPGKLTIQYTNQLRMYAGEPDSADASHFTIRYDLDGKAGIIDGWLRPGGNVVLQPQIGKVVNSVWYPHAK